MEQISEMLTEPNKLQATSSKIDRIANPIPIEKQRAMGDVFDRWRLNCGWNPWDNKTQLAAIASFVHTLDREGVPSSAYGELYERVLQMRAKAMQDGKQIPNFGVDLMVAVWSGEWGLRNELRQRDVDRGRTLTGNAESVCSDCGGTGWKTEQVGAYRNASKCDHGNVGVPA